MKITKTIKLNDNLTLYDLNRLAEKGTDIFFSNGKGYAKVLSIEQRNMVTDYTLKDMCKELDIKWFEDMNFNFKE